MGASKDVFSNLVFTLDRRKRIDHEQDGDNDQSDDSNHRIDGSGIAKCTIDGKDKRMVGVELSADRMEIDV